MDAEVLRRRRRVWRSLRHGRPIDPADMEVAAGLALAIYLVGMAYALRVRSWLRRNT